MITILELFSQVGSVKNTIKMMNDLQTNGCHYLNIKDNCLQLHTLSVLYIYLDCHRVVSSFCKYSSFHAIFIKCLQFL